MRARFLFIPTVGVLEHDLVHSDTPLLSTCIFAVDVTNETHHAPHGGGNLAKSSRIDQPSKAVVSTVVPSAHLYPHGNISMEL